MCAEKAVKFAGLRAEMARHGHNQQTLAELLDMPQSGISNRLQGNVEWKVSEIEAICGYYGKPYEELFK